YVDLAMYSSVVCCESLSSFFSFFFFNATATTAIYTLSLHDALPICLACCGWLWSRLASPSPSVLKTKNRGTGHTSATRRAAGLRSEEHTSELQSPYDLVCRLLLEKKKNRNCQRRCLL